MRHSTDVTVSADYFRDLYRRTLDPWDFTQSAYEAAKYAATLEALPRERYAAALELGCSIGVFTALLAPRCEFVLAVDVSEEAIASARLRCAPFDQVRLRTIDLICDFPEGRYDLVLFCELGFYFNRRDLHRIMGHISDAVMTGGTLVLVHWTPCVDGHAMTADEVHEAFIGSPHFISQASARAQTYRLDVLQRR
jgi:SAM-dependent methyltransferase